MLDVELTEDFKRMYEHFCYSVDIWTDHAYPKYMSRRYVLDTCTVERKHDADNEVFHTVLTVGLLHVALDLRKYSNYVEHNKAAVLRFGHHNGIQPVVAYLELPRYTKRKTINKWLYETLVALMIKLR